MSAKIAGNTTNVDVEVDATSKAFRETIYDSSGTESGTNSNPIIVSEIKRTILGMFYGHSGNLVVQAAAHATTAGFIWLLNPVSSTVNLRVRRVSIKESPVTAVAFVTAPRITIERMTFTGVITAVPISDAKRKTSDAISQGNLFLSTTGITPVAGAVIMSAIVPAVLTAVGIANTMIDMQYNSNDELDDIVLIPGEGIVVRQADAGSTSDTRKVIVDIEWEEFT